MRHFLSTAVIAAFVAAPLPAGAQAPDAGARDGLVVSAAWLAQHVNDPDLVLLHVGAKPTYDAGHIANARYVTLARPLTAGDGAGTEPDARDAPGRRPARSAGGARHLRSLARRRLPVRRSVDAVHARHADARLCGAGERLVARRRAEGVDGGGPGALAGRPGGQGWQSGAPEAATRRRRCRLRQGAPRHTGVCDRRRAPPRVLRRNEDRRRQGQRAQDRPHRRRGQRAVRLVHVRRRAAEARGQTSRRCSRRPA